MKKERTTDLVGKYTISLKEMERDQKRAKAQRRAPFPADHWRPQTRADCEKVQRPCPYVSCRYNLFLDVAPNGSLRLPYTESPEAVLGRTHSCALDLAAEGGRTLEEVGKMQAITRERVRQIEESAREKVKTLLYEKERASIGPDREAAEEHSMVGHEKLESAFVQAQMEVSASLGLGE